MLQHPCQTCVTNQLFNPCTRSWSFAGNTAANGNPVDPFPVVEIGPQAEMPAGSTFVVGAGSNTLTQVPDVPNAPNDSSYYTRMLALPNGQVLLDDGTSQLEVYTAGVVTYARTSGWTSVSVAPGTRSSTGFTLPPGTPAGKSTLVVVANGIASPPSLVTIF